MSDNNIELITSLGVVGEKPLDTFKREVAEAKRKGIAFVVLPTKDLQKLLAVAEAAMALGNALTPEERASQALFPEYRNLKDAIAALEAE